MVLEENEGCFFGGRRGLGTGGNNAKRIEKVRTRKNVEDKMGYSQRPVGGTSVY